MDITGLSMAVSDLSVQSQVGIAVMDKALEHNEEMGKGLVEMMDAAAMERSVNPAVGSNYDVRV